MTGASTLGHPTKILCLLYSEKKWGTLKQPIKQIVILKYAETLRENDSIQGRWDNAGLTETRLMMAQRYACFRDYLLQYNLA